MEITKQTIMGTFKQIRAEAAEQPEIMESQLLRDVYLKGLDYADLDQSPADLIDAPSVFKVSLGGGGFLKGNIQAGENGFSYSVTSERGPEDAKVYGRDTGSIFLTETSLDVSRESSLERPGEHSRKNSNSDSWVLK